MDIINVMKAVIKITPIRGITKKLANNAISDTFSK